MPERPRMRPLEHLLAYDEALRRVLQACRPLRRIEAVPLAASEGRVLARPLRARIDVPGFDRAAMDGYAVRAADLRSAAAPKPVPLGLEGTQHAGRRRALRVRPGTCVQIATGAPIPPGADTVVQVELTTPRGRKILFGRPLHRGANISRRGGDMRRGQHVLPAGAVLTPARIAAAAAQGLARVPVWARPRVLVLSTGSELKSPGRRLHPGEIYSSNAYALQALLPRHGAVVKGSAAAPDRMRSLVRFLRRSARIDLIVVSGGSSAGERDLLRDAVAATGRILFHGVRVKPGKPLLLGRVGQTPLVGLPGYPASCLCDAYLFLVPALRRMARLPPAPPRRVAARLATRVPGAPGRLFFVPVQLQDGTARSTYTESGATTSLVDADGFIEIPPDRAALPKGARVTVTLF